MSSLDVDTGAEQPSKMGTLVWLLDPASGFLIWAGHFLVIYIAAAVACVLGLGAASAGARSAFLTVLGFVTAVSAVILVLHAAWSFDL